MGIHTPINVLMKAYAIKTGISLDHMYFVYNDSKLYENYTPSDLDMNDGDMIDAFESQTGGKPVIILYPLTKIQCDVSIELEETWKLTSIYPTTKNETNSEFKVKWNNVIADPDGKLIFENKEYPYLFWESITIQPMFQFDFDETFCVKSEIVGEFLNEILELKGLNFKERCDFITFWLHQLQSKKFVLIQFLNFDFYSKIAKLKIECSLKPDTIIREFFIFSSCDEMNFDCKGKLPKRKRERNGFVVVEWGALNMNK